MDKYLAFDYGKKRIGVSVSAEKLALRLPFIPNEENLIEKISKVIDTNKITKLIIGIPLNNEGNESEQSLYTKKFIERIKSNFSLPVIITEESLTTNIAVNNLKNLGFKSDQILKEKDSESARIMLQEYLDNI